MPALDDLQRCKEQLRRQAHTLRRQQPDRATLSRITQERVIALPEYRPARTVMCYVDFRSEIETRATLTTARQDGKRVVVPYCVGDCLGLFVLDTLADLAPGTMGILEPRAELRGQPERSVVAAELDLIVVPGLVFDAQCADRLRQRLLRSTTARGPRRRHAGRHGFRLPDLSRGPRVAPRCADGSSRHAHRRLPAAAAPLWSAVTCHRFCVLPSPSRERGGGEGAICVKNAFLAVFPRILPSLVWERGKLERGKK